MASQVDTFIQKNKGKLSEENITALLSFDSCNKANELTNNSRYHQIQIMTKFATDVGKDFKDVTRKDVENYIIAQTVSNSTMKIQKIIIRKFFLWFYKTDDYPECVRWIKLGKQKYKFKEPKDLLTEKQIKRLIDVCDDTRNKTIISLLWDTAIRVGELTDIKIGNVTNAEGEHISITVTGKTGTRTIGLLASTPHINAWLNLHPDKENKDAYLFCSRGPTHHGGKLDENSILEMLQIYKQRAGIEKRITPHVFRHSRLTYLAKNGMPESIMRNLAGWERSSIMPAIYLTISSEDVYNKMIELETGTKHKDEPHKSILLPIECKRCHKQNDQTNSYCSDCWFPLTIETVDKDVRILSAFKSKFIQQAIDVDQVVRDYYQFKTTTEEYIEFYEAFEGKLSTTIEDLHTRLQWPKKRFEAFINGLVEVNVLKISKGVVTLQTYDFEGVKKTVFDNFIRFKTLL